MAKPIYARRLGKGTGHYDLRLNRRENGTFQRSALMIAEKPG